MVLKRAPKELKSQWVIQTAAKVDKFVVTRYTVSCCKHSKRSSESWNSVVAPQQWSCTKKSEKEEGNGKQWNESEGLGKFPKAKKMHKATVNQRADVPIRGKCDGFCQRGLTQSNQQSRVPE